MKIEYSLTLREFYRYQGLLLRRSFFRSPLATCLILAFWIVLILFPWANDYYMRQHEMLPLPINIVPNLILDAILIFGYPGAFVLFMPLVWLLNRQHMLDIDKNGVAFTRGRNTRLRSPWSAIDRVDQDADYIYIGSKVLSFGKMLFADPTKGALPLTLVMLPKRAFSSPFEAQSFFDLALAYQRTDIGQPQQPQGAWPPAPTDVGQVK